jgi:hypothetical protein
VAEEEIRHMPNVPERKQRAADVAAERAKGDEPADSPTTTIDIDAASPDGRRRYKGAFKFKVPTLGDRADIAVLKTRYLQQISNVGDEGVVVAEMLAYLSITLDESSAPEWWKTSKSGLDLYDYAPVMALYGRCREYEAKFLGGAEGDGATEGAASEEPAGDTDSGVVEDVQPPPERREVLATVGKGGSRASPTDARVGGRSDGADEDDAATAGAPV